MNEIENIIFKEKKGLEILNQAREQWEKENNYKEMSLMDKIFKRKQHAKEVRVIQLKLVGEYLEQLKEHDRERKV